MKRSKTDDEGTTGKRKQTVDIEEASFEEEVNDERNEAAEEPILMGLNVCGCAPGEPCSTMVFSSPAEALDHAFENHFDGRGGQCPWWGCDAKLKRPSKLKAHYASQHIRAQWKCVQCSETFYYTLHREARQCAHPNQHVEVVMSGTRCLWGTHCQRPQQPNAPRMAPAELREHCLAHLPSHNSEKVTCQWLNCNAQVAGVTLSKHVLKVHLGTRWKCRECQTLHERQESAAKCCIARDFEPVEWATQVVRCKWDGCEGPVFEAGPGEALRAHFKTHLFDGTKQCQWEGCEMELNGARSTLKSHLEQVHGALKFRCPQCHAFYSLKDRKKAAQCNHGGAKKKKATTTTTTTTLKTTAKKAKEKD